jgi:guanylate kinase
MFISEKEFSEIVKRLTMLERAEKTGLKKNYLTNQVGRIRLILKRARRRDKDALL